MTTESNEVYCVVPSCKSTKLRNPEKLFFGMPMAKTARTQWMKAIRREKPISPNSFKWCCQDHFTLEDDVVNWMRYRILKEEGKPTFRLSLKKGVVPHKFDCQPGRTPSHTKPMRPAYAKRQLAETLSGIQWASAVTEPSVAGTVAPTVEKNMETLDFGMQEDVESADSQQLSLPSDISEFPSGSNTSLSSFPEAVFVTSTPNSSSSVRRFCSSEISQPKKKDMSCQAKPHYRSVGVTAKPWRSDKKIQTDEACHCFKKEEEVKGIENAQVNSELEVSSSEDVHNASLATVYNLNSSIPDAGMFDNEGPLNISSSTVFNPNSSIPDAGCFDDRDSLSDEEERTLELDYHQKLMRESTLHSMRDDPRMFLGVDPENFSSLMKALLKFTNLTEVSIFMTLRKLRLNESNEVLAKFFSRNPSSVSRTLKKAFPILASYLKTLIFWPDKEIIQANAPLAFRAKYSKVQSIIDCFEIEIQKPGDPVHQSLSWSSYKHANTVKYLVSITPDGLINYVSEGYTGRGMDPEITKVCGYYDQLKEGTCVMADRGFKLIDKDLTQRKCTLAKPDSVENGAKLSQGKVRHTKTIASLRIHVERVIRRIREYQFCSLHACFNHNLLSIVNYAVVIACALVNLQGPLIH